jgi:hypothetical protein
MQIYGTEVWESKWKNMERKGFKQKEESADGTDITAMKPEPATI